MVAVPASPRRLAVAGQPTAPQHGVAGAGTRGELPGDEGARARRAAAEGEWDRYG